MVPSKWVSKPGQAEPEQLKTPSKVQRCGWFKETNAASYKGEGPDSTREHLLPGGVGWDGAAIHGVAKSRTRLSD